MLDTRISQVESLGSLQFLQSTALDKLGINVSVVSLLGHIYREVFIDER